MKKIPVFLFCTALIIASSGFSFAKDDANVIQSGKKVTFDYTLTVDGKVIDSSKGRGPVQYTHG